MSARSFLVEIGTEELPPKSLARIAAAFAEAVVSGLASAGIAHGPAAPYFSPRRLAVIVEAVADRQPDSSQRRLGPAVKAAFDKNGKPTRAAEGFAASCGVAVDALERVTENGKERVACTVVTHGRPTGELLAGIVTMALAGLPVARRMRWAAGDTEFVRPVHWIVMLLGGDVIDAELYGVRSGAETRGHRFLAPQPIRIGSPGEYVKRLHDDGKVRLNDAHGALTRYIRDAVETAAGRLGGVALGLDGGLADEVAALNEWPVAIVGGFDEKYLELPPEVLVTTLQTHQRYFPIAAIAARSAAPTGSAAATAPRLLPHFIAFANIESRDPDVVRRGNERVVVPRLEDAMFFWNQDRKVTLASRRDALDRVTWQQSLGSVGDKVARIAALVETLAPDVGADAAAARRAGELAKCDLLTAMVGEFPELQGTMGRHYALNDGEPAAVAAAIEEHYLPRHAGDRIPATAAGSALALADRLDTLAGIFGAGGKPGGDKDPYGLRRAALGVLRILVEGELDLDLERLIGVAVAGQRAASTVQSELFEFFVERLRAYLAEAGTAPDTFEAVLAVRPTRPLDFVARVRAVEAFRQLDEAEALAAANKRIANILRQAGAAGGTVDEALLVEAPEQALGKAVGAAAAACEPLFADGRYADGLRELAALRGPVDRFFDAVMVMTDDEGLRANRLALLASLHALFRHVADIGRLQ